MVCFRRPFREDIMPSFFPTRAVRLYEVAGTALMLGNCAVSPPASAVPTLSCAASLASKRPRRTQDPDIPSLTRWCNFRYSSYTYCAWTSNWLQGSQHEPGTLFGTGVALDSPHDLRRLSDGGQLGSVP